MASEVIAAIATPPGRGGIGVVRVSGPRLETFLFALVGRAVVPRRATRADFRDSDKQIIDQGLVLHFPSPHSYTGEDVVELHGHGGPAVLQLLLDRCLELGARVAQPGEFTKRAFLNDKLDLAQAEGVADLISASTSVAARCAVRSLQGEFSERIATMVHALIALRTLVEATLDFPDDEVEILERADVKTQLGTVRAQLSQVLAASRRGSLLREGAHVVLAGQPNVGKSSLMNCLAGGEHAIVTDIPGTTRDAIRVSVSMEGVPLHIIDTAGLREPQDEVEKIGISKTWAEIAKADLVLWVSDGTRPETRNPEAWLEERLPAGVPRLLVVNKVDLCGIDPLRRTVEDTEEVWLSAKTGLGLDLMQTALLQKIGWDTAGEGMFMARARHLHALQAAAQHLTRAESVATEIELFAEELKVAQHALSSITGEFTADDLLGEIFANFCIGK